MSYICATLNVFFAGIGTILSAYVSCKNSNVVNKTQLFIGLAQLMTSVWLVGWFASIYWGYLLVKKARGDNEADVSEN